MMASVGRNGEIFFEPRGGGLGISFQFHLQNESSKNAPSARHVCRIEFLQK